MAGSPDRRLRAVPDRGPRRAGLYVRVSDVGGRAGETFHSPDTQLQAMRGLCERQGWLEVSVWTDLDRTGRTFGREGVQAALKAVREGVVDTLVVYDCSRLGRNTAEALRAIQQIRDAGAVFASVSEQIDDTPAGQLALTMFLGLAQHYSDTLGVRWRDVHRRVFEQGRVHGPAPLGYRRADGGRLEPDPVFGPAIRDTFARYAAGTPIKTLAADLSRLRGRPVDRTTVRRLLGSPTYTGSVRLHGQTAAGQHEPLVDDRLWRRVQQRLTLTAAMPKRRVSASWSLSGLVVCDACGRPAGKHVGRGGVGFARCRPPRMPDLPRCPGFGFPRVADVEAEVLRQVRLHVAELDKGGAQATALQGRRARARAEERALHREARELEKARSTALVDRARRRITEREAQDTVAELDRMLDAVHGQLAVLGEDVEAPSPSQTVALAAAMLKNWDRRTPDEKRAMLRAVVREVRLRPPSLRGSPLVAHDLTGRVDVSFR